MNCTFTEKDVVYFNDKIGHGDVINYHKTLLEVQVNIVRCATNCRAHLGSVKRYRILNYSLIERTFGNSASNLDIALTLT